MARAYKILGGIVVVLAVSLTALGLYVSHDSPCGAAPALAAGTPAMQAIVYRCYGSPEVLKLESIAKPVLADDRVLVKVHAASINPLDWHYMRGKPYIMRLDAGVGAPKVVRIGVDFAGTVEAVGKNVKRFKPGDEVFGGADGAFAEYVTVREDKAIALKPADAGFAQAAALPIAAITALQALRDKGRLQPGQKLLINGASGGVGTYAVQIGKALGAEVTGVCSARNAALARSLGAAHVIDYGKEDFTQGAQRYDLILDAVGNQPLAALRRVLTPNGTLVMVGGAGGGDWLGPLGGILGVSLVAPFVSQHIGFMMAQLKQGDLVTLARMMQDGKLTSAIDRHYPLAQLPAALAYLEDGHARGKVIIDVAP